MKKWTIGMVNYHSSVYIKWQLKILHEFNSENDFDLIIIDNSRNRKEFDKLQQLCKGYNNVQLIQYSPTSKTASGQHGEGLDQIRKITNSKYLITQDPDFFWLKKDYLLWLEKLLQYNDAVGIPYINSVMEGQSMFPGAFGCAYIFKKIKNKTFKAYINDDVKASWDKHHDLIKNSRDQNHDFCYDVGWKIRKGLSQKDDYNFISFHQEQVFDAIGEALQQSKKHSFQTISRAYYHNNEAVCLHLFRGTFTGKVKNHQDPGKLNYEFNEIRSSIAEFIYNSISNNGFSFLSQYKVIPQDFLENTINSSNSKKLFMAFILLLVKRIKIIKLLIPYKKKDIVKMINRSINHH